MLLYMMELENMAESGADVAPSKPIDDDHKEPEKENVAEETEKPEEKDKKLTRSEIMKMNVAQVRAYAEEQGIEGANAMSGAELKRILGNKLFEESE